MLRNRTLFFVLAFCAERLVDLFIERNVGLQFDISQDDQTEAPLLSIEKNTPEELLFRLSTSTAENFIKLEFRATGNRQKIYKINAPLNDRQFHKIIVVLNGNQLQVVENCHLLVKADDHDIDFSNIDAKETRVYVGEQNGDDAFHGQLREFTADTGNPIHAKCPELELFLDNPVSIQFAETTLKSTNSSLQAVDSDSESSSTVQYATSSGVGRMLADEAAREYAHLAERFDYLEGHLKHWNSVFQKFDTRIKKVELHLRGCQLDARILSFGERHQYLQNCSECQCSSSGILHCGPIGCPRVDCAHPLHIHGSCCPECGKQCYYNGRSYENGEEVWPKQCVRCICDNGRMECQFKHATHCPVLTCPYQETPPNQCCPVCVNIDHCATNPCHSYAYCESSQYGPTCKCNPGFFGNGTVCYDVDECLWDESAREQLGGCQKGTICINLPGSFKCDCLPGYQKLDDKHCLDVIRI
ncbi:von willebrand factor type C domain-containing protein [Ditylenchus destructor]|nr:von willebrand factor type C domain-containing protein [Ditylenchus destructor]